MQTPSKHSSPDGDDHTAVHDAANDQDAETETETEADPSMGMITDGGDDYSHDGGSRGTVAAAMVVSSGGSADQTAVQLENVSVGSSVVKNQKRRWELNNPPPGIPTCFICKKEFSSWKGVFGHMKLHPERPYRGFMPPPTFSAVEHHMLAPQADNSSGGQGDRAAARAADQIAPAPAREAVVIPDLNEEPMLEDAAETLFDLNHSPPGST